MSRYFIITVFVLAVFSASAVAAEKLSDGGDVVHGGGLVCFSIVPPRDRETTCNRLCADRDAACVGLKTNGAMNPGTGCADALDPKHDGGYVASCRCCAVGK
jgi:hypothetical protein